jgi:hypothetical protein
MRRIGIYLLMQMWSVYLHLITEGGKVKKKTTKGQERDRMAHHKRQKSWLSFVNRQVTSGSLALWKCDVDDDGTAAQQLMIYNCYTRPSISIETRKREKRIIFPLLSFDNPSICSTFFFLKNRSSAFYSTYFRQPVKSGGHKIAILYSIRNLY